MTVQKMLVPSLRPEGLTTDECAIAVVGLSVPMISMQFAGLRAIIQQLTEVWVRV